MGLGQPFTGAGASRASPNGSSRPGPNLYTNSLMALDHKTGKMLWYNQVKPHDLFNLDFQISPMLATVSHERNRHEYCDRLGEAGSGLRI